MRTAIIMPDDVALEKANALRCLGAQVERVRPASIVDTKHVRPLSRAASPLCPPDGRGAESRNLLGFSMWYDIFLRALGADGADNNRTSHVNMLPTLGNVVRKTL